MRGEWKEHITDESYKPSPEEVTQIEEADRLWNAELQKALESGDEQRIADIYEMGK